MNENAIDLLGNNRVNAVNKTMANPIACNKTCNARKTKTSTNCCTNLDCLRGSVVVETFPRPQYLLKFFHCHVHKNSNYRGYRYII